jgi:hypothetical protein
MHTLWSLIKNENGDYLNILVDDWVFTLDRGCLLTRIEVEVEKQKLITNGKKFSVVPLRLSEGTSVNYRKS